MTLLHKSWLALQVRMKLTHLDYGPEIGSRLDRESVENESAMSREWVDKAGSNKNKIGRAHDVHHACCWSCRTRWVALDV